MGATSMPTRTTARGSSGSLCGRTPDGWNDEGDTRTTPSAPRKMARRRPTVPTASHPAAAPDQLVVLHLDDYLRLDPYYAARVVAAGARRLASDSHSSAITRRLTPLAAFDELASCRSAYRTSSRNS